MNKPIWVDPPSGWRYGFPKIFNESVDGDFNDWIIKNGYPKSLMDSFKEHFYVRMWEASEEELVKHNE